jgi:hypothetical protein
MALRRFFVSRPPGVPGPQIAEVCRAAARRFRLVSIDFIGAISDFVTAHVSRCNNDKRLKNDVKRRSRSR